MPLAVTLTCLAAAGLLVAAETPSDTIPERIQTLLHRYCLECHAGDSAGGGIDLAALTTREVLYRRCRDWNKVPRALRDHLMPPTSEDQPTPEERREFADWVDTSIQAVARDARPDPGQGTIRRLNRVEYAHTMRDLLGLDVDAAKDLPSDAPGNGFDNQGDTLFIPPILMEKYLDATKRVLQLAFDNPDSRRTIFGANTGDSMEAAEMILSSFVRRAFRRPAEQADVDSRLTIVKSAMARGKTCQQAIQVALESVLLSPNFLFRIETRQAKQGSSEPYRISDYELATRLSYFLWATMPDEELFDFADANRLHEPEVLRAQVERMLADPKSISLAEDFASQWFGYRGMRTVEMDIRRFGKFGGLRDAMYFESMKFFDSLFRDNGCLLDILDCDYAYVNEALANHYGIPNVKGGEIRRVALADRRRGGVVAMGSTLATTSYPTRTSPAMRGKWVLEQLLGSPPPPPPPNVKPVSKDDSLKDGLSLRQRFEKHRADATCASCHARMDPIGFGLENFDGIGEWRDSDNGVPIDNSAQWPDGTTFRGPEGLKEALMARKERFVRHMVEKTMTYALGRPIEYYDEHAVRTAMDRLSAGDYRFHELIHAIVESYAFQHRKNAQ